MRREHRLRSKSDFRRVTQQGRRLTTPEFVLYHFAREAAETPRIGLRVSRRVGGAVVRNRVKRVLREALRPHISRLRPSDIVIVARPAVVGAEIGDLERKLGEAAARAGLFPQQN